MMRGLNGKAGYLKTKNIIFALVTVLIIAVIALGVALGSDIFNRQEPFRTDDSKILSRQKLSWLDNPWDSFSTILAKEEKQMNKKISDNDIPVYHEKELLFNTNGMFYLNRDACFSEDTSARMNDSGAIMAAYPTSAIRHRDDDSVYTIYDTDTGYRFYLLFSGENEYVIPVGFPLVVKEKLSYADFSELKIGDSIEQVEKIDSIAGLYKKELTDVFNANSKGAEGFAKMGYPYTSIHYFNDGILKIEYTVLEDKYIVISDMEFNKDYQLVSANGKTVNYKIADADLPQNW